MSQRLLLFLLVMFLGSVPPLPNVARADAVQPKQLTDDQRPASTADEVLDKKLAEREAINLEIQRLRQATGRLQHVAVHVSVAEPSRNKIHAADITIDGVDSNLLRDNGVSGLLATGVFDNPGNGKSQRADAEGELAAFGVIENVKLFNEVVTTLKNENALEELANQTMITVSGRPASFLIGGEIPVPRLRKDEIVDIEFKEFGTRMDCLAVVLGGGKVRLELRPRVSQLDDTRHIVIGNVKVPGLRVRQIDTGIELNVGQTLVFSGVAQHRTTRKLKEVADAGGETDPATEQTELIVTIRCELLESKPQLSRF